MVLSFCLAIPSCLGVKLSNLDSSEPMGALSLILNPGALNVSGKILIIHGAGSSATSLYDPDTDSITPTTPLTSGAGYGSTSVLLTTGPKKGLIWISHGSSTQTSFFDTATSAMTSGPNLSLNPQDGANLFLVSSGARAGQYMLIYGGAQTQASFFDPQTLSISSPAPASGTFDFGSNTYASRAGKALIINGGSTGGTTEYDFAADTFAAGPVLSASTGAGSFSFLISSGLRAGKTFVAAGNGSPSSSIYDPSTNSFSSFSGNNNCSVGNGGTVLPINSGPQTGSFFLLTGNSSSMACYYDPSTDGVVTYVVLNNTVSFGGSAETILKGPRTGQILIVHGNGALTTDYYDPATGTLTAGPVLSTSVGVGGHMIQLP